MNMNSVMSPSTTATKSFKTKARKTWQKGATVIEYALIAGLLSIASVIALFQVGTKVDGSYQKVATATTTANS